MALTEILLKLLLICNNGYPQILSNAFKNVQALGMCIFKIQSVVYLRI